ncbi:(2Fe-2S)-binding protein [Bradyrhizobium sp. 2TAF24]|uniref:(2Fe-2S)-binding protein n=1 Tax=Bradyrhizobium sp. 2TAF24 TaxID=3233011 RepID=UPI003F8F5D38
MPTLKINGKDVNIDAELEMPLLWAIRDYAGLTGTKYGCGIAQCGACTVHLDGEPTRSCSVQLGDAVGKTIVTIEGLAEGGTLHRVQQAWVDLDVPQCGYCQSGLIMAVTALLKDKPKPTDKDIDDAITNICRCGTFVQVRAAIHAAANA